MGEKKRVWNKAFLERRNDRISPHHADASVVIGKEGYGALHRATRRVDDKKEE
jgi:hypothetical protein